MHGTRRFPIRGAAPATVALLTLASSGCGLLDPGDPPGRVLHDVVAFRDVAVVPLDSPGVLERQTVVVRDRRIATVGPADEVAIPDGAHAIDGSGRYLMPGLADMHVHLDREDLRTYLANGVTTVRNMWGYDEIAEMRDAIAAGELDGPTVHSTSPGIDGTPPKWPYTQIVQTAAEADSTVVRLVEDEGWTMLKVYQDLRPETYDAVVAAARRLGVRFMGHVPHRVGLRHALESGQASLEHLGGFDVELGGGRGGAGWLKMDPDGIPEVVSWTRDAGAYVSPTLVIVRTMARGRWSADQAAVITRNRRTLVRALHEGGVPILLGTDSGIDVVDPGTSIHEELDELVRAGLSPYDALRAGTVTAARFLGAEDEFGAVREGLRADLLLLADDPLQDVGAAAHPLGVMANGVWFSSRD